MTARAAPAARHDGGGPGAAAIPAAVHTDSP